MIQFLLVLVIAFQSHCSVQGWLDRRIAKRSLRPVERMAKRAEGITARNLQDRLEIPNPGNELGQLASVFNHLLDRLEQFFEQL